MCLGSQEDVGQRNKIRIQNKQRHTESAGLAKAVFRGKFIGIQDVFTVIFELLLNIVFVY